MKRYYYSILKHKAILAPFRYICLKFLIVRDYILNSATGIFKNTGNNLREVSDMTRKTLLIFTATVVAVLFSFTAFTQEPGQETAAEGSKKSITRSDLENQKKSIERLRSNYAQLRSEYDTGCKGKTFSADDEALKMCQEKSVQLTNIYSEMKRENDAYKKNLEQYKANHAETSPDAIGPTTQSN